MATDNLEKNPSQELFDKVRHGNKAALTELEKLAETGDATSKLQIAGANL